MMHDVGYLGDLRWSSSVMEPYYDYRHRNDELLAEYGHTLIETRHRQGSDLNIECQLL